MAYRDLATLLQAMKAISPMPDDEELVHTPERIDEYLSILEAITSEVGTRYDKEVIAVLLRSFGLGDGFEVYWATLHFIESFRMHGETYELVRETLVYGQPGPRKWSCRLLGRRRNREDIPFLLACLTDTQSQVVREALHAIGMVADRHPDVNTLREVAALTRHGSAEIAQSARDTFDALTRCSDDAD